jgi:uncharacterized protein YkwD
MVAATFLLNIVASTAMLFSTLAVAAPTATQAAPLAKRTTGPSCLDSSGLQKTIIGYHNSHRTYHQVSELEWDSGLANYAQNWVNKCVFQHSVSTIATPPFPFINKGQIC